jgi:outer membrane protein assembly factor BamA
MNEQIELAAFFDVGDALFEDQSLNLDTVRASAGFEVRFHLPIFPVPLRLIYGWPVRKLERDRTANFTFSIGRSF